MELSYWQSRWRKGHTGFHMEDGYPGLEKHWHKLQISPDDDVLVPLCGKTRDMIWLSSKVKKVIGVEVAAKAVREFFSENKLKAEKFSYSGFEVYTSGNIEIWCGDFLKLPLRKINNISLVYDKSALVALPPAMRKRYADKVTDLCNKHTKILLHLFEYEQKEMNGPPFSVTKEEIISYFGRQFIIRELERSSQDISGYQKFAKRGLKSYLIEYLLVLLPDEKI